MSLIVGIGQMVNIAFSHHNNGEIEAFMTARTANQLLHSVNLIASSLYPFKWLTLILLKVFDYLFPVASKMIEDLNSGLVRGIIGLNPLILYPVQSRFFFTRFPMNSGTFLFGNWRI